jgi:hypothetical protein
MDSLTATVEIIKALAWPIAALIILKMFREPLMAIIPFIEKIKAAGVEVTIAREVAKAKALAQDSIPDSGSQKITALDADLEKKTKLFQIGELAPRAAISEAWRELELAGANAVSILSSEEKKSPRLIRSPMGFAEALMNEGLISENQRSAISTLRRIRNESVHLQEFSLDQNVVRDYIETAFKLAKEIRNIKSKA